MRYTTLGNATFRSRKTRAKSPELHHRVGLLNLFCIPLSHLRGSSRGSLRFDKYFCRRKAAVVARKVADGLRFNCGQYGSFTVFAVYLRFPAVLSGCRTAQNRGLNRIRVKGVLQRTPRASLPTSKCSRANRTDGRTTPDGLHVCRSGWSHAIG